MASNALALEEDWPRQAETPVLALPRIGAPISRVLAAQERLLGSFGVGRKTTTPVSIEGSGAVYVMGARAVVADMLTPLVEMSGLMTRTFTPSFAVLSHALSPTVTGWNLIASNVLNYGRVADVLLPSRHILSDVLEPIGAFVGGHVLTSFTPSESEWLGDFRNIDVPSRPDNPLEATHCLLRWFDLTYNELSAITGVARGSFFYWQRTGATPYRKSLRKLWRLYALADAVVGKIGERAAAEWLRTGDPTPMNLLREGRIDEAENRAQMLVLADRSLQPSRYFTIDDLRPEASEDDAGSDSSPLRRSSRLSKRRRLE